MQVVLRQQLQLVVVQSRELVTAPGSQGLTEPWQTDPLGGRLMLGSCSVDWRKALTSSVGRHVTVPAELCGDGLAGAGTGLSSVLGVVELQLELLPPLAKPLESLVLRKQLQKESSLDAEKVARFSSRAREWWKGYVASNMAFRERLVKVLAYGEDGLQRPVCGFVRPLRLGRLLTTPREAARWVALLARKEEQVETAILGGVSKPVEAWSNLHSVLASGMASTEERATLLCSILLGFGLDAWVAVGRDDMGGHMWVVTIAGKSAVFWEPATGERIDAMDPTSLQECPYQTVDCLFNNRRVCANRQIDNSVHSTLYHLQDSGLWCELRVDPTEDVAGPLPLDPDLKPTLLDASSIEMELEAAVCKAIEQYRWNALGLSETPWSSLLSYLMMPALAAYEQEAVTGQSAAGNEEFRHAVKRAVPTGYMFKGFPKNFCHRNKSAIAAQLLAEPAVQEMVSYGGGGIELGLRVKAFLYPEDLASVWVMVCAKQKV